MDFIISGKGRGSSTRFLVEKNPIRVQMSPHTCRLTFTGNHLPSKLSDNLVQQFLLPDQTPPILEAEMSLRAELQTTSSKQTDSRASGPRQIYSPDPGNRQEVTPEPLKQHQEGKSEKNVKKQKEKERMEEVQRVEKKEEKVEERMEPEGRPADTTVTEHHMRERVMSLGRGSFIPSPDWLVFVLVSATQLKPDEGTPELPEGRVRVRLQTDGSLHDVTEYEIEKCNPSELDLCEDLSDLQSVNECGVLHNLTSRAKANLPLTHAGPNLVNLWPPVQAHSKCLCVCVSVCVCVCVSSRALSSQQLTLSSVMVVDPPGLRNPRHSDGERAAGWPELCHNYLQERLLEHYHTHTFTHTLDRYTQEKIPVEMECPENSPAEVVSAIDQPPPQVDLIPACDVFLRAEVKNLFSPKVPLPPLCRGLGGLDGSSQRSLQRNGTIRKTLSGGMAAIRRHSQCIAVKLQADALVNLIRRARPVFLQCVLAKTDGGGFDVPALRVQLHATQILSALQLHRTGYPDHMSLSDFRCHFQALSPPIMKRYASMFVSHDERKAVEELLGELDLDKKSIVVGASRVFMKRGVLGYLEQQRDQQVTGWLIHLQAACVAHLARQRYRKLKVSLTAVTSELSDERFRGDAVGQALDVERVERIRLGKENKDLQARLDQCKVTMETLEKQLEEEKHKAQVAEGQRGAATESELAMQLECCQTEVEFVRRRLKQTEEKLETERQTRQQLDTKVATLQTQLEQSRRSATDLKRHCRRVTSDLQDARVLADSLQGRMHEVDRKQRRFDSELTQALEEADTERELKDKAFQENAALGAEIYTLRRNLQVRLDPSAFKTTKKTSGEHHAEGLRSQYHRLCHECNTACSPALQQSASRVQFLEASTVGRSIVSKQEARVCDLENKLEFQRGQVKRFEVLVLRLRDSVVRLGEELEQSARAEARERDNARYYQQRVQDMRLEMEELVQREQDSGRRRMELDLRVSSTVGGSCHVDLGTSSLYSAQMFLCNASRSVPCIRRTPACISRASFYVPDCLSGVFTQPAPGVLSGVVGHRDFDVEKKLKRDLKRTHALLADAQLLLSTVDSPGQNPPAGSREQIERLHCQLEESEAKRLQAESLQATLSQELDNCQNELENICKQKSMVDEQLVLLQHEKVDLLKRLEEDQEDLNELMKKHKALIAQSSSDIAQIRELQAELEEVKKQRHSLQEEEMQVEELGAVRQTLQADLETSIRRIVDLQAALEEVESSDESDCESVQTAVESLTRKKDLDSVSSVGTEDVGEGIRHWLGVPRGASRGSGSPYGSSTISSQGGRQSVADTMSTYSFRSCVDPDDEPSEAGAGGTRGLGRAPSSALSELLDGLRKRRAGGDPSDGAGSAVSLPVYQTTAASTLRRRASALSLGPGDLEPRPGPGILKPPSPLLQRAASARSIGAAQTSAAAASTAGAKLSRFNSSESLSSLPSLPRLSSLASSLAARHHPPSLSIPEEDADQPRRSVTMERSPQPLRRCMLGTLALEDGGEGALGSEPMVFQNRRLIEDGGRDDTASDILPAIRRAQSTSSLAGSLRGGRRALSVHFGELPPSTRSRKSSETESSSSGGSGGSSQGGGTRRRFERPQGERLEAEGSEGGDVASVMKRYLKKETD
ncbi:unconventional myosin-XVIIIb-like [Etheostoma cragini]|uniref:unconventional myosin-XVIIIb-like n=1 Tax=Etheostoma cragini TaxID=417921 RepID=UPI00155E83A7|nr:unconventional myosin-XVIIIb-like [Etheostoma cragini]